MKLRTMAAVCAAVMSLSSLCAPATVFAATASSSSSSASSSTNEADMKKALTLVKSRLTIPSEYSDFSYSSSKYRGLSGYTFTWKDPKHPSKYYTVTTQGDIISSYRAPYVEYTSIPSFGSFTPEDYAAKAQSWVEKVLPEAKGTLKRDGNVQLNLKSRNVTVRFTRVSSDINVSSNYVNVTLDKENGNIMSMNCSWWQNASFQSPAKALTQQQIQKIYANDTKLGIEYRLTFDGRSKAYKAVPVYFPQTFITYSAFTGKPTTMDEDRKKLNNTDLYEDDDLECVEEEALDSAAPTTSDAGGNVVLTEEELAALDEYKGLLSSAEFKKLMIKDPYIKVTDKFLTDSYRISKSTEAESGFMINCRFYLNNKNDNCTYTITADAKTGKVYSFYRYSNTEDLKNELNVSKASKTADAAAKYYCSSIWSHYKANPDNSAPVEKTKYYTEKSRCFSYNRYENNIKVAGENIRVTVNSDGIVTSMSYNHTKNVDFGSGKIISEAKAFESLFKQRELDLYYEGFLDLKSKPYTYLHYRMESWNMNAETGRLSYYDGTPMAAEKKAESEICPYTDISSSPYKNEIVTLYNYGVRTFSGTELAPKAVITTEELSRLMSAIGGNNYGIMPLYSYDEEVAVEEEDIMEEYDGNEKKNVTRLTLAKQFVISNSFGEAAQLRGIYKSPFKDISETDPNIGYIAIANAIGAAVPDAKGNFVPNGYVTREYAMHIIYNYVKVLNASK